MIFDRLQKFVGGDKPNIENTTTFEAPEEDPDDVDLD
jgi:hypothetical protein